MEEEEKQDIEKDLYLIYSRIGHQIKIHRNWILNHSEENIIKFVKGMGNEVREKCKVLKLKKNKTHDKEGAYKLFKGCFLALMFPLSLFLAFLPAYSEKIDLTPVKIILGIILLIVLITEAMAWHYFLRNKKKS